MEKSKSVYDTTQELFDLWLKTYNSTLGRLTEMPAVGPTREKNEKIMKDFSTFVNFSNSLIESTVDFQQVFLEALNRMQEKIANEKQNQPREDLKDYYKMWVETYSETLHEFLKSEHFSSDLAKLMSNFMDFQKYNREIIDENILKPANIPTKSDIDDIYKELYSLKKTVKELKAQLRELSQK